MYLCGDLFWLFFFFVGGVGWNSAYLFLLLNDGLFGALGFAVGAMWRDMWICMYLVCKFFFWVGWGGGDFGFFWVGALPSHTVTLLLFLFFPISRLLKVLLGGGGMDERGF